MTVIDIEGGNRSLSNHEWAKLVQDKVQEINQLLHFAPERDVIVQIKEMKNSVYETTWLTITLSEKLPS